MMRGEPTSLVPLGRMLSGEVRGFVDRYQVTDRMVWKSGG